MSMTTLEWDRRPHLSLSRSSREKEFVWSGLVWSGLVWSGLVWSGLRGPVGVSVLVCVADLEFSFPLRRGTGAASGAKGLL
jgi:hypothetical protein